MLDFGIDFGVGMIYIIMFSYFLFLGIKELKRFKEMDNDDLKFNNLNKLDGRWKFSLFLDLISLILIPFLIYFKIQYEEMYWYMAISILLFLIDSLLIPFYILKSNIKIK